MKNLIALSALVAIPAIAGDFLPLQTGNEWTYREAKSGHTITVRVATPAVMNDRVYYSLQGYTAQRLYVRNDENGNVVVVDPETYREQPLTVFEVIDRAWWNAPYRDCEQEGQTQKERADHDGPAGPISKALVIHYRTFGCADIGVQEEQFAENIGMLRRVETSIAGPRVYDLVSARIGRQSIQADAQGRFSVSLRELAGTDEVEIRMELNLDPAGETRLQFYSGQQYDAVIRNSSGHVVWRWSEGQMFTQAVSERLVSGRWVITLQAPRPFIPAPAANRFTVEGWLPTIGGNQFAAATPFSLSVPEE